MKVQLHMGEWMITMGLIGLHRVFHYGLDKGIIEEKYRNSLSVHPSGLEVDIHVFPQLPKAYFLYLIDEYSVTKRDCEKLDFYMKQAANEKQFKTAFSEIKKIITKSSEKIEKYFSHYKETLQNMLEILKQLKKYEQLSELAVCMNTFKNVISDPAVNEKLTLNYFKAAILKSFFGQVSFLNVSKNSLDLEGHIREFQKDYITPILLDTKLELLLANAQTKEEIIQFLEEHKDYQPFKALKKVWKSKELQDIQTSIKNTLNRCIFLRNHFAFYNFEEMTFSPISVSKKEAVNFNWGLNDQQPRPISSLAKLVLFFAPAGASVYTKKEGVHAREFQTYFGFVQTDASFQEILQKNNHFKQLKQANEPFDRVISRLIQGVRKEAGYVVDHLFFLEFSSDYDSKKTHLHYYHLPLYVARYFQQYGDKLDYIKPYEYRESFVQAVLQGVDPKGVIYHYLRHYIEEGHSNIGPYIAVRERNRIMQLKKGVKDVSSTDKRVNAIYRSGQEIRRALATSAFSPDKKINSVAYRLLNAAKAGNQKNFMDTLFRLHMSADKPIAPIFLNALHERDLDFATVANAFIAGLLSSDMKEEQEESVS